MDRLVEVVPFVFAMLAGWLAGILCTIWLFYTGRLTVPATQKSDLIVPGGDK